jgi:dihydrofolate reductase
MGKLFLHMMISLDGYIAGPDGQLDWHFVDREYEEYSKDMLASIDAILLGRNVYELFEGYWPKALKNPAGARDPEHPELHLEAARLLNDLPKYVVSSSMKNPGWNNTSVISQDLQEKIQKLKRTYSNGIALFGGATLSASLLQLKLIDEFRLVLNPVILGTGTPLFRSGFIQENLERVDVRKFDSGALLIVYKPAGR